MSVNKTEFSHFFRVMTTSIIDSPALDEALGTLVSICFGRDKKYIKKPKLLLRLKNTKYNEAQMGPRPTS